LTVYVLNTFFSTSQLTFPAWIGELRNLAEASSLVILRIEGCPAGKDELFFVPIQYGYIDRRIGKAGGDV